MATYPTTPPFPHSAVAVIGAAAGPRSERLGDLKTVEFPAYAKANVVLQSYLEHYKEVRTGAAVGIMGEFGSGKTHLIGYLMSRAARSAQPNGQKGGKRAAAARKLAKSPAANQTSRSFRHTRN